MYRILFIFASFYLGAVAAQGQDSENRYPSQSEAVLVSYDRLSQAIAASHHPEAAALQDELEEAYANAVDCLIMAPDPREAKKCQMNFEYDANQIASALRA